MTQAAQRTVSDQMTRTSEETFAEGDATEAWWVMGEWSWTQLEIRRRWEEKSGTKGLKLTWNAGSRGHLEGEDISPMRTVVTVTGKRA